MLLRGRSKLDLVISENGSCFEDGDVVSVVLKYQVIRELFTLYDLIVYYYKCCQAAQAC